MGTIIKTGLVLSTLLALLNLPSYATSHYVSSQIRLSHMQRHTESLLSDAEARISQFLTPAERQIQRRIVITVPPSFALIAHAYPGNIVISSGTFWILEQLTLAHIADRELNYLGCEAAYTKYIVSGLIPQTGKRNLVQYSFKQLPLEAFARQVGGNCAGFGPLEVNTVGNGQTFTRLMRASMTLVYLHELGHHVLGHVERLPMDFKNSKNLEAAADAWAIEAAFRAEFNILDGTPALNLIAALGAGARQAGQQTHPPGAQRVRKMLHLALEILAHAEKDDVVTWLNNSLQRRERKSLVKPVDTTQIGAE